ncbi:hypothetical protein SEUCBS139899_007693 [Sporothrix eucalyptigena]|uniref:Uncharacterized protein n=1 Tax=Sporothrix eucalyptigena TaxID=1812306 RepID=A0ABP0CEN6_9PEZI
MDRFNNPKAEFPATYAANGFVPAQKSKARRIATAVMKTVVTLVFTGLALALIYQVIHDKQAYDNLLSKYNELVAEQETQHATPTVTLMHRAIESATPSVVYTTTTVTQGTTITIQTTAPSSSLLTSSAVSSSLNSSSTSIEQCSLGTPETVTVTVTADASSSAPVAAAPSSDAGAVTIMETHVTTATIFVTASGLVSPKAETLTITATETQTATVNGSGANNTPSGTSTSTAEGVKGPSAMSNSLGHTHFPNSTTILGYGTTGIGEALTSTASYTLTVPPGVGPTGTGGLTSPPGTSTSQADPVSTVVTVSGARKTGTASVGLILAVAFVAAFHF